MKEGTVVKGRITAIKPYGAFVKIDDQHTGLIHISEFSDRYVRDITDYVHVGDVIDLKVVARNGDGKVSLSYKRLHKRKRRYRIRLTHGFKPLKKQLPQWIQHYRKKDDA